MTSASRTTVEVVRGNVFHDRAQFIWPVVARRHFLATLTFLAEMILHGVRRWLLFLADLQTQMFYGNIFELRLQPSVMDA
jgi:hypothetical protein